MSEWRVNLQGDKLDLEELAALLTSPDRRIRREEGRYFLVADRLNNIEDVQNVRETAEAMLLSLNGLARLRINARKPLSVGNIQRVEDDGITHRYMLAESEAYALRERTAILKIGEGGNEEVQQEDPLSVWFTLAESDVTVARVMSIYGRAREPWKDLYPIFEFIKSDMGGKAALVSRGWTSGNQIELFTRTANHSEAAGEGARHGASTVDPPPTPMTPGEAWMFIGSLMSQWLEFKQQNRQTP